MPWLAANGPLPWRGTRGWARLLPARHDRGQSDGRSIARTPARCQRRRDEHGDHQQERDDEQCDHCKVNVRVAGASNIAVSSGTTTVAEAIGPNGVLFASTACAVAE